jgi:hypothetical protein
MSETAPSKHPVGSDPVWQAALDLGAQASARPEGRNRRRPCLLLYGSAASESPGGTGSSVGRASQPSSEPTADGAAASGSSGTPCVGRPCVSALRTRLVLRGEPDDCADWLSWM